MQNGTYRVSIHSRLFKPGESQDIAFVVAFVAVSIHSRLFKPGESIEAVLIVESQNGFNPLPII